MRKHEKQTSARPKLNLPTQRMGVDAVTRRDVAGEQEEMAMET